MSGLGSEWADVGNNTQLQEVVPLDPDAGESSRKKSMSPVNPGYPWNARAWSPTSRHLTSVELSSAINSPKSALSFIGTGACQQLQQETQMLLTEDGAIIIPVSKFGIEDASKLVDDLVHGRN